MPQTAPHRDKLSKLSMAHQKGRDHKAFTGMDMAVAITKIPLLHSETIVIY